MQRIAVLGATGSIGRSTLDVIQQHPDRYQVTGLAAHRSVDEMASLCRTHAPSIAVMTDSEAAKVLADRLRDTDTEVIGGDEALVQLAADSSVDTVMAAVVGFAGLASTLAAARAGKRLLLANKESLVSAGQILMSAVHTHGATLLPIDSEHNAMFQCLPTDRRGRPDMSAVEKVILTASGGPFRGVAHQDLLHVTPEQACAHPNWSMGRKISVDSATLANKGLELAEACWLFDSDPTEIDVVVHPQSIVHSMIRYHDGSVLAQMGQPDMRTPIAYGLGWPERVRTTVPPLDLVAVGRLDFEPPDLAAFPCLALAQAAIRVPGGMCVFNAANEVAVAAFLEGDLGFTAIPEVIDAAIEALAGSEPASLAEVEALDARTRTHARLELSRARR